ncbi:aspartyl-phosphate phosphatase Spo0E family protein [Peribacillus glennii]|uniref:Aspartyl-phosphate phosphatase Spo0E family protein n=1 Tax=Peribacillus glennii TaxID=2303991 RepID=A0A372L7Q8_9BACI|nr:aspartyl-phosphate phosphatase Spo0E family protein [Peribacillus glennii]
METKTEFLALIEKKRIELFHIVSKNGLNSNITLQYSQELDQLLNQYNKSFIKMDISP